MISRGSNFANMAATGAVCSAVKPDSDCHGTYTFATRVRPCRLCARTCDDLVAATSAPIASSGLSRSAGFGWVCGASRLRRRLS